MVSLHPIICEAKVFRKPQWLVVELTERVWKVEGHGDQPVKQLEGRVLSYVHTLAGSRIHVVGEDLDATFVVDEGGALKSDGEYEWPGNTAK